MKKLYVLLLLVLMGLMLQPVSSQVNAQSSNVPAPALRADGGPKPLCPPYCATPTHPLDLTIVSVPTLATGTPSAAGTLLLADGGPKPLCPPYCATPSPLRNLSTDNAPTFALGLRPQLEEGSTPTVSRRSPSGRPV